MKSFVVAVLAIVALCSVTASEATATDRFWINNHTDIPIIDIRLVDMETGDTSKDLLGDNGVISPHDSVLVLSTKWEGCIHDIDVVNDIDQYAHFKNFNTCIGGMNIFDKAFKGSGE